MGSTSSGERIGIGVGREDEIFHVSVDTEAVVSTWKITASHAMGKAVRWTTKELAKRGGFGKGWTHLEGFAWSGFAGFLDTDLASPIEVDACSVGAFRALRGLP